MGVFNPDVHRRRSIRLKDFDYSTAGAYFITICAYQRECLFGEVKEGKMEVNEMGRIVASDWMHSENVRKEIVLDEWVIMPNHFHGIVWLVGAHGNAPSDPPAERVLPAGPPAERAHYHAPLRIPRSLSTLVAGFKRVSTMNINRLRQLNGVPVWQRNYYERIIRTERELNAVRQYIRDNPLNWDRDGEERAHYHAPLPITPPQ